MWAWMSVGVNGSLQWWVPQAQEYRLRLEVEPCFYHYGGLEWPEGGKCYPFYFTNCFRKQTSLALAILVSPQQELFSILSVIKEMIDILACRKVKVLGTHSCLTLCNPMDRSPPGSSVHGMLQARTLECVAISSSKGSSQPRDQTQVSSTAGRCFTIWAFLYHLSHLGRERKIKPWPRNFACIPIQTWSECILLKKRRCGSI